ncbi:MAG: helix-turn-helix transcriptional regulator [Luteolibacter sp.]
MSIPELTHLQIAVLDALGPREKSGRELREALKSLNVNKSGPAFYQMMARLEDSKFVTGKYDEKIIDGQRIKERRYTLTGEGAKAMREARQFYTPIFGTHEIA